MKGFPWRFDTRPISRRERLVIIAGAAICGAGLVVSYALLPFAERWGNREERIAAKGDQLARLEALIERRTAFESSLTALQDGDSDAGRRLLHGDTRAVAASRLVSVINGFAAESGVALERVDVSPAADTAVAGLIPIPLDVRGQGDVRSLVDFLFYLQFGEKLIVVDDFFVNAQPPASTAPFRAMTWGARVHGYYAEVRTE